MGLKICVGEQCAEYVFGQNERRATMKNPQMLAKMINRILLAIVCVLVLGWFHQAETRAAEYPYVPLMTKISPFPRGDDPAWVEFHSLSQEPSGLPIQAFRHPIAGLLGSLSQASRAG